MMTAAYEPESRSTLRRIFSVVVEPQTYLNIGYLLLAFPLGLAYFIILVVGLALGFGLFITLLGIPILLGTLGLSWVLSMFERQLSMKMLDVDIAPMSTQPPHEGSIWNRLKTQLVNPVTWKGIVYLFLKFPFGIVAFCLTITLAALSFSMVSAPLLYRVADIGGDAGSGWQVDSLPKALGLLVVGIPVSLGSLWLLNFLAAAWAQFARLMLGDQRKA
jgi:hypothetical protein